jgi:MarR family transcriptional regulator, organic hydroperoxide resistance regulator
VIRLAAEDGLTPGELAQRLHVTTPTIVKMATRMEAAGLLTRRRDEKDARLVRLHLTDRARSLDSRIDDELRRLEERATANLTREEGRHLESALTKIIRNLEESRRRRTKPPRWTEGMSATVEGCSRSRLNR